MSEAADGMGVLAASGMKTNDILKVSGDMFNLMSAGSVDADTAASVLTNTMAQFGVTADGAGYVVDTFAAGSSKAKVSVDELQYAMSQAGGSMSSMNMSVTGSVAAIGHLTNAGMEAGKVGTTINAMSREIKANADAFKKLGVEVYDPVTGDIKEMGQVMEGLEGALKGKTDAERDSMLQTVFSGQAMEGATAWINKGSDAYSELADEIFKAENAAETMAAIQEDTVGGAFRAMKSATEGFMIEIGDVVKKPVQEIAKFIAKLAGKFGELSGPTKKMIVGAAALAAAIGPVIWIGGKLMWVLGAIMSPIGLLVAGVVGLATVFVHLWKTNEEFRDKVIGIWETIKSSLGKSLEFIKSLWEEHGETIKSKVSGIFESIGTVVMGAIDFISGAISTGIEWIQQFWTEHGEFIKTTAVQAWQMISTTIGEVVGIIVEKVSIALEWIQEFWSNHGETIMSVASSAWNLIMGVISAAMTTIQGVINVVLGIIQGDWSRVWTGIQGIFEGVMDAISAAWNFVKDLLGKAIKGTVDAVTEKFHSAMDKVKEKWKSIKNFLKNPIKGIVGITQKNREEAMDRRFPHKTGAYNIPYNEYPASLHKGEMVLTASASDKFRAMGGTEDSVPTTTVKSATSGGSNPSSMQMNFSPSYNIEVNGNMDEKDASDLLSKIDRQTKKAMDKYFEKLALQIS